MARKRGMQPGITKPSKSVNTARNLAKRGSASYSRCCADLAKKHCQALPDAHAGVDMSIKARRIATGTPHITLAEAVGRIKTRRPWGSSRECVGSRRSRGGD